MSLEKINVGFETGITAANKLNLAIDEINRQATFPDTTPANIKIAYESNPDTNALTDADRLLLDNLPSTLDTKEEGIVVGQLIRPLKRVGLYVPGGTAAYPSSVLMTALPGKVAGVEELVMISGHFFLNVTAIPLPIEPAQLQPWAKAITSLLRRKMFPLV